MAKSLGDDIAVTATYMLATGVTHAVVYGCNTQQENKIKESLQKAGDSVQHPLLIIGVLAELERDCLLSRAEQLLDKFVHRTEALRNETRGLARVLNSRGDKPADILDLYDDSRDLMKRFQEVQKKLYKMTDHIQEFQTIRERSRSDNSIVRVSSEEKPRLQNNRRRRLKQIGLRMKERLFEIIEEYDSKIEDCKIVLQDLTVTTQIVSFTCCLKQSPNARSDYGTHC